MADRIIKAGQLGVGDIGSSTLVDLGEDQYLAGRLTGIRFERSVDMRLSSGRPVTWTHEFQLKIADLWVEVEPDTPIKISQED
jgi:hypothetical protein